MGSGGGNDQSGSGGFSLDDVAEEGDGQANGREQSLDDARDVVHGSPGPDGDSNENDNNNAGNGSDDNDGDHSNTRVEDKTNDSKDSNGWGSGGENDDGYGPGNGDGEDLSDDGSEENAAPSAN